MLEGCYPWHLPQIEGCLKRLEQQRLPHALLCSGIAYSGKLEFASALADALLCQHPAKTGACGNCSTCHLLKAGSHPDFRMVEPVESSQIRVVEIRETIDWANQTAQQGGRKVALIHPADKMNISAANALLKLLEEPPANTYLILVTSEPGRMLATIRSRCQVIVPVLPSAAVAREWLTGQGVDESQSRLLLSLSRGSPVRVARQFDQGYMVRRGETLSSVEALLRGDLMPMTAASTLLDKDHPVECYEIMMSVLADAARAALNADESQLVNPDALTLIQLLTKRMTAARLVEMADNVAESRKRLLSTSNPNEQLLLEATLIELASRP